MTHVHYKFSSKLSYDTVVFDGPHITLSDLKRQIMGREKLRAGDCDLQITNAQTKEEYMDDEGVIPKGSSVIIKRIPVIGLKSSLNSKIRNIERADVQLQHTFGVVKATDDLSSSRNLPLFSKMANLAHADVSEEDKIKVVMNQSTCDSMNYNKKPGAALPANYTCYRCGNTGHHIRNCPTSGVRADQDKNFEAPLRLKKSTGIPRSFMVEVDDPSIKGAMLTNSGHYAIPAIHAKAYAIGKKEKPPFIPQKQPESQEKQDPVPEELLCPICHDLLSDAVVIPCCANSYCDDCIRTALLDSEDHVCPTCGQSDTSPDTLIANKFLRQAVNTFIKERGHTKRLKDRCGISHSENQTPVPIPVSTQPALTIQSQPQKLHQLAHSQQDPLIQHSQPADMPSLPQVCGAPPTATDPAPATNTPRTSIEPVPSHPEISDKETEEKAHDDSQAAAHSVLVSHKDPTAAAASQLIPLVNHPAAVEQPQTDTKTPQQPLSGPSMRHSETSTCWDSSPLSCPTIGWSESLPPSSSSSSSYPATPPPPFPSSHFHSFLTVTARQPFPSYPPGYPPATPVWTLPTPQGAPIPSLCSPATTSSVPNLIHTGWYMHQSKKKERSPHRRSTYRHSSSRSHSKSSKSKSSRSYSRSLSRSRSRSRSRSKGQSRHHSPYHHRRGHQTHSRPSHSYSYGYKRSPTPSSSSSPRAGHHSRSKSPSDHQKSSHHSHRHSKKSTSSSYNRKRGECSQREEGGSEVNIAGYQFSQHANQTSNQELDKERYQQWKRQYKEWCEKYLNSYVSHFHHLPPPPLNHPYFHLPQWEDKEGSRKQSQENSDFHYQLQGGRTAQVDGRVPHFESSSDSRSPPSQSSSDSRSTPSQSSSDSRSTPSQSSSENIPMPSQSSVDTCYAPPQCSSDSRSTPSQSSSDSRSSSSNSSSYSLSSPSQSSSEGRSTPSQEGAQLRTQQPRCPESYSHQPVTLTEGSKEAKLPQKNEDDKELNARTLINFSTLKHETKNIKKHEAERGVEYSFRDAADSTDDCRKDKRRSNTGVISCKDDTQVQDKATAREVSESVQPLMKQDRCLDKDHERKSRERRHLERDKERRKSKYSDSRQDSERQHKEKPSKRVGRVHTDRYRNPGGSRASDSRSEKNRKRKGEDVERSSVKTQSSKSLKTKTAEVPKTSKSESPVPFERKKPKIEKKKEKKTWPLTESDIWEGGIKVKPQKKISININLLGKMKEEETEKPNLYDSGSITEKTKEETEKTGNGEEEKFNRGGDEVKEKKEASRDQEGVFGEKIKPDEEAGPTWKKTFSEDKREMRKNHSVKEENFDMLHCTLKGGREEKKESKKQWEQQDGMDASNGEEVTNDQRGNMRAGKEEDRRVRNDGRGQDMAESVAGTQEERAEGENPSEENRRNLSGKSKPEEELMGGVRGGMSKQEEEDTTRSVSHWSLNKSHHGRPNTSADNGSSHDACQERRVVMKTLEEYTQDRTTGQEDELVLIQVPRSKWDKEESEEEVQDEGVITVKTDAPAVCLPSSSVCATTEMPTKKKTEQEHEQQRHGETEGDRAREMKREKNSTLSSSHRCVAPPCGKERPDSILSAERYRDRKRVMKIEKPRDRQRERESERPRDKQKGRTREEEKAAMHSSNASVHKRNPSSSSHSNSNLTSCDSERRDLQRGDDQSSSKSSFCPGRKSSSDRSWESSRMSTPAELPEQNTHKMDRDTSLDLKFIDRNYSHYHHNPQIPSDSYRHLERPEGSHHSSSFFSPGWSEERPLSEGSELSKPRMSSPDKEFMQNICRNESKVEKVEWKQNKMDTVIKERKEKRNNQDSGAEREGRSQGQDEAEKLDEQTKWERGRKMEKEGRPSGNIISSSASTESSSDDRRKDWKKKQKKHKREKKQPAPQLLEEGELTKHKHKKKKFKKSRDGEEDERSEVEDSRWKEEEEHAKLCSVMSF